MIVHLFYAVGIGLAFVKNFGTSCNNDHVYRKTSKFNSLTALVFIVLFGKNVLITLVILFFKAREYAVS